MEGQDRNPGGVPEQLFAAYLMVASLRWVSTLDLGIGHKDLRGGGKRRTERW